MNLYTYISCICILIFIVIFYIKIKYPFWTKQPVVLYYKPFDWLKNEVIENGLPNLTSYVDLPNVKTRNVIDILNEKTYIQKFVSIYYLNQKDYKYKPSLSKIFDPLLSNNEKSYITFYFKSDINNKINNIINNNINNNINKLNERQCIGLITANALNITFKDKPSYPIYYVDHLCIHPDYRKKGITPKLIHTHYYNLRHNNNKIKFFLLKKRVFYFHWFPSLYLILVDIIYLLLNLLANCMTP